MDSRWRTLVGMNDASEGNDAVSAAHPSVPRVRGIRSLVGCSLSEALDELARRYERQCSEQAEASEETPEDDGHGHYS